MKMWHWAMYQRRGWALRSLMCTGVAVAALGHFVASQSLGGNGRTPGIIDVLGQPHRHGTGEAGTKDSPVASRPHRKKYRLGPSYRSPSAEDTAAKGPIHLRVGNRENRCRR